MTDKDKTAADRPAADKAADQRAAEQAKRAEQEPRVSASAAEHPLADPDSPQGFVEVVTDPHTQGSTELPRTPADLEERAVEGIPSVQTGAPEQAREDELAKTTGGAGEPYVGHGDNQPGGQPDPMADRKDT